MQKRGRTAAGTQRWYCSSCESSAVGKRPDTQDRQATGRSPLPIAAGKIQRCLVHIERRARIKLTRKPKTRVGKQLLTLLRGLFSGVPEVNADDGYAPIVAGNSSTLAFSRSVATTNHRQVRNDQAAIQVSLCNWLRSPGCVNGWRRGRCTCTAGVST